MKPQMTEFESDQTDLDCIYEAQLSVMITGVDDWVWTSYCFIDRYFRAKDTNETVESYLSPRSKRDPRLAEFITQIHPYGTQENTF
jgi:hypothetical protein